MGSVEMQNTMSAAERGKSRSTKRTGVCTCSRTQKRVSRGHTSAKGTRRTEGGPRRNHLRDWNVGSSGKASAKVSLVGDADKGRMVESVLARLWRGEDGVEKSVSSWVRWRSCKHLDTKLSRRLS